MTNDNNSGLDILANAAQIVRSYVANNSVPATDIPALIVSVHRALSGLGKPAVEPEVELEPAVPIRKSVTPDFIICLDDGKKFKSLGRHLRLLGMTAGEYRTKWGLPVDYPMVAPNYAATRSALAKSSGLGRKPAPEATPEPAAARKARAKKAG